ncbi:autotransporter assembly complex protein TamA [Coxiella burnetii]|uniref:autotransporter assembly complex protein TamA n=1 Tax=Coxiella burnetii TaxID=777 RepID=UPI000183D0E8|nr:BamA/TamA family outer membrane protein [Coxiella burnetii]ACJ19076.1 outer membrane protein [Coxiella burnetii CbuG_Q212]ATN67425.1 hypothetical protein AYM17_08890 [Coxiella burnetii]OYK85612.1 outer membrane protein assembly factor [Coxiella burnetii]
MKEHLCTIFILFCWFFSGLAWAQQLPAATNTLEVQIAGLPPTPLENVFKRLSEKHETIKHDFVPATIRKFYEEIPKEIEEGIKPYGYFKPHIHGYIRHPYPHFWFGHFTVNPGPRMQFTQVKLQITGPDAYDRAFLHLYENFPVKAGDFFDSEKYESAKNDLFNVAAGRGFFKARMIRNQILVDLKNYRSTVIIVFDTGPRFLFGTTDFSATPFHESFLHRFLQYRKGHYFSQDKVQRTREGLANSDYFSTVVVTPEPQKAQGLYVPVKIHLDMQPKKQYNFGLGFGTDTGPRALVSTNLRWINPYGHRFNAYLRAPPSNSALVANYIIPGSNPATDLYTFSAAFLDQDQDTGKGRSGRLSVSYQTNVGNWQQIISLTALRERYNLRDLPRTNAGVLYPSISWEHRHADNTLNPSRGHSIVATISGASESVLSKTSFLQTRLDTRFLFTAWERTRFIIRASVGYTAIKNILNLPLSLQFFAGGAQSMRGFSFNSIGPGRGLFVGSFEIQEKIVKNIYLASFIDVGNVSDRLFNEKLKIGVGPGIVLLTPVGMFELTIANAISEPKKPWVIQFSMGSVL